MLQRARLTEPRGETPNPKLGEMVGFCVDGDGEETASRSSFHLPQADHFPERENEMSNQNWQVKTLIEDGKTFSVKLSVEMIAVLEESQLVLKMKDDYPWVVRPATCCPACAPPTCGHGK
jgi:hypothetical protein